MRKRAAPKVAKEPQKAPKNNYFSTLMLTEEGRALRREWSTKKRKNPGRPMGTPDGYRLSEIKPIRAKIKKEARKVIKIMAKEFNIDDEYSKEALTTAVEVLRSPGETRERLAAARLVLDFCRSKPVAKSDITVGKAEDFLASLLPQIEDEDGVEIGQEISKSTQSLIN